MRHNNQLLRTANRRRRAVTLWRLRCALQKAGGFKRAELNKIARLVHEHEAQFLEKWNEFFSD